MHRRGIGARSYRSSFAKKRLPFKEITSHGGAIIFLQAARIVHIYIYRTSSLTDRERWRTKKKEEPSQSQDNLPLKTFAKPRQNSVRRWRDAGGSPLVYSSWKSRRRAFTSSPPLFRHFLMHRTRRTSQRIEEASFFHPLPFQLCPNSIPLPMVLLRDAEKPMRGWLGEDYVRSIISRVMQYRG